MMKKSFLFLMAFSAIAVFFSCSSDDDDNSGNQYDAHRGIVKANQEVDLGIVVQSNGKAYKVIFAKNNLTATGLATSEYLFGDFFAWGATEPWYTSLSVSGNSVKADGWKSGKSSGYVEANAPYCIIDTIEQHYGYADTLYTYSKYTNHGDILEMSDDAARKILGGDWRIPTRELWEALIDNTTQELIEKGVRGVKFVSVTNDQTLFLPSTDEFIDKTHRIYYEPLFAYRSSTAAVVKNYNYEGKEIDYYKVYVLKESDYYDDKVSVSTSFGREKGLPIRPVRLVEIK